MGISQFVLYRPKVRDTELDEARETGMLFFGVERKVYQSSHASGIFLRAYLRLC